MTAYTMFVVAGVGLSALLLSRRLRILSPFEKIVNCALILLCIHATHAGLEVFFSDHRAFRSSIHAPYGVFYGPLYYFGVRTLDECRISREEIIFQVLPFLILAVFYLFLALLPRFRDDFSGLYQKLVYVSTMISLLAYGGWAFFGKEDRYDSSGNIHEKFLGLLGMVLFMGGLIRLLPLLDRGGSLTEVVSDAPGYRDVLVFACMLGAAVTVLSYRLAAVRNRSQNTMIVPLIETTEKDLLNDGQPSKYAKSSVTQTLLSEYERAVKLYLVEEGAFLEEDISLEKVAKKIRVPRHHLSQVFTFRFEKSFNHFVNDLRVAHARKLMLEKKELSLTEIGEQSGFASRVSFYRQFRRVYGCSPSEYFAQMKTPGN